MRNSNLGTRFENYENLSFANPYILNGNIVRTAKQCSSDMNWHENVEIQWIKEGEGSVILNENELHVQSGDIILVNSNVLHYTGFTERLKYGCLILDTKLLNDLDVSKKHYKELVRDGDLRQLLNKLEETHTSADVLKKLKAQKILLEILLLLNEKYAEENFSSGEETVAFRRVKKTVLYIRNHYREKISLDRLAQEVYINKFLLAKEFKKITGRTLFRYINDFRCKKAADLIRQGCTVTEAAFDSGFNNVSYFIRTYKKIYGESPSKSKKTP